MQTIFGLEFPVFAAAILLADLQIGKADPSINLMRGIVSMVETGGESNYTRNSYKRYFWLHKMRMVVKSAKKS
ncbi:MAG TPA: hypothetical protein EYN92_03615 [Dehalococcoidia bacterium]|nr:hypothetical protein [Dehalococcoidia bacterium]